MVCVGAYAPTHTIFALLLYDSLSRHLFLKRHDTRGRIVHAHTSAIRKFHFRAI